MYDSVKHLIYINNYKKIIIYFPGRWNEYSVVFLFDWYGYRT